MYQSIIPAAVSVIRIVARPLSSLLSSFIGISYADSLVRDGLGIQPSDAAILEETAEQPTATEEQIRGTLYISYLLKAIGLLYVVYYLYCIVMKLMGKKGY